MPAGSTLGDMIRDSGLPIADILHSPEAVHAAATAADYKLAGLTHGWLSIPGWGADLYVAMHSLTNGWTGGSW